MKRKILLTIITTLLLVTYLSVPAFAGWEKQGDVGWKYTNEKGQYQYGWIEIDDNWYYLDDKGYMKTGWLKDRGSWYYLHADGTMAHDTWIDNYYVNNSGKWVKTR